MTTRAEDIINTLERKLEAKDTAIRELAGALDIVCECFPENEIHGCWVTNGKNKLTENKTQIEDAK